MSLKETIAEIKRGSRKPSCFQDLFNLQSKLDGVLAPRQKREREVTDICMSMLAEVIEFQEETKISHKTWGKKEFNEDDMKVEAIDILFFYCQLVNHMNIPSDYEYEVMGGTKVIDIEGRFIEFVNTTKELLEYRKESGEDFDDYAGIFGLISTVATAPEYLRKRFAKANQEDRRAIITTLLLIIGDLGAIYGSLGMDTEEIYSRYFQKWNENLDRVGKGKDGKGWL